MSRASSSLQEPPRASSAQTARCTLCEGVAQRTWERYPGYRAPQTYSIFACDRCDASFASPLRVESEIYDAIYQNPAAIPGYDRYAYFAAGVLRSADPLRWLAHREDVYWAVAEAFKEVDRSSRCLEIGCGLGYLTYALNRAGWRVQGLDVSGDAVGAASRRYGSHFRQGDASELAANAPGSYDVVVMTELIEHLERPVDLLASVLRLVRPHGRVILTTPNKSYYPAGTVWETEAPPVHLWWFSERSIRHVATELRCTVEFIDFSEYDRVYPRPAAPAHTASPTVRSPIFDEHGRACFRGASFPRSLLRPGLYFPLRTLVCAYTRLGRKTPPSPRRETLAATLSPKRM